MNKKKQSQNTAILEYLKSGKSISPWKALLLFKCFRLSGRIWELRYGKHNGVRYNIGTVIIAKWGKHFASYHLERNVL